MKWNELRTEPCPIARFLSVLGDRWTLLILREAFLGARRFEAFRERLDISPTILTRRLGSLCEHDIFERMTYQERPPRQEYRLTRKGVDLYGVLMSITHWGNKHDPDDRGPSMRFKHTKCAHDFVPEIHCSECGEAVPPLEVRVHRMELRT